MFAFLTSVVTCVCINASTDNFRSYYAVSGNLNVFDCSFSRTHQFGSSGGILYYSGSGSISVINSMFYNCKASGNGGAIYFSGGTAFLDKICGEYCASDTIHDGQFYLLYPQVESKSNMMSLSYCGDQTIGCCATNVLYKTQYYSYTNVSRCYSKEYSGPSFVYSSLVDFSYCTVSNNVVSEKTCVFIYQGSSVTLSFSNFVGNNSPSDGVLSITATSTFNSCVFSLNSNRLFNTIGTTTVKNSFIAHPSANIGSITQTNNTFATFPLIPIVHFNSYYCEALFTTKDPFTLTLRGIHQRFAFVFTLWAININY